MIHKLAVRALLRDYEEGAYCDDLLDHAVLKAAKCQDMIDLSCQYNVVCSLTSFLAIETRDEAERASTFQAPVEKLLAEESPDLLSYLEWGTGMKEMQVKYDEFSAAPSPPAQSLGQPVDPTSMTEASSDVAVESRKPLTSLDKLLQSIQTSLDASSVEPYLQKRSEPPLVNQYSSLIDEIAQDYASDLRFQSSPWPL